MRYRLIAPATAAGITAGAAFAISPMSVFVAAGLVLVFAWASAGLDAAERKWMLRILTVAVVVRVLVMAATFFYVSHPHLFSRELSVEGTEVSYLSLFGDESYAKRRSIWMRDIWLGFPIAPENYVRAFEEYGWTGYFHVLAILQIWFGPMPLGMHLMNALLYLAGAVALYRAVRSGFGPVAALEGLALVLFLPTLFIWSVSALKEPLYFFLGACAVCLWVRAARSGPTVTRVSAAAAGGATAVALGLTRPGATELAVAAAIVALVGQMVLRSPRRIVPLALTAAAVCVAALALPSVRHRVLAGAQAAAHRHLGSVEDPGTSYRSLDDRFYAAGQTSIATMTLPEAGRYSLRALVSFVFIPFPGQLSARGELALLLPQILWFASLILLPWGIAAGLRQDSFLTLMLLAYAGLSAVAIALNSGNVGSLVRHRDTVVPFVMWVSAIGSVRLAERWRT